VSKTAAEVLARAGRVFRAAVADNMVPRDPFASVSVGKPSGQVRHIPTVAEVVRVAEQGDVMTRTAVLLAASTGLRVGELRALTVGSVDFLRRRIRVDHTMVELPGEPWRLGEPKTAKARRTVRVPAPADPLPR
jgi:integrase